MIKQSHEIIFTLPVSRLAKLVYLFLCFISDEDGQCSPSLAEIQEYCDIKARKTLIGFLNELENVGIIKIENRTDGGYTITNLYTVYEIPYK